MQIGEKLKKQRQALKLSQEQVAQNINISRQTLSNWENNHSLPDIVSILLLSNLYHQSLDDLLKGDVQIMHKFEQDQRVVKRAKGLNVLTALVGGVAVLMVFAAIGYRTNTFSLGILRILIATGFDLMTILSVFVSFRTGSAVAKSQPYFQKRVIGKGWSVNPRNVWGVITYIVLPLVVTLFILAV